MSFYPVYELEEKIAQFFGSNYAVATIGYYYYMTPESAEIGLSKLPKAISAPPKIWTWKDYPDLTKMAVLK